MKKFLRQNLYIFFFLLLAGSAYAQRWERIPMSGQFNNEYWLDVFFLPSNPNYGWACGQNFASVIRTTDGGQNWTGTFVPTVGNKHLESIHFATESTGYTSGPPGIFKSTDGGATWTDVTPSSAGQKLWGCYFLDANVGVAVGDGCGPNGPQRFYRTTDGGANWTEFFGTEPTSGLTDALLYLDGTGFAVSSGVLWSTTDNGASWQKFANTGSKVWQEEITRSGNSFLLPFAGLNCDGGGNTGGMRFSQNNGGSWTEYSTGSPMFGTFLINSLTGWACGYNNNVWYTSDGGQTWDLRNCGAAGHHDDMWFINSTTGWLVGSGGIFKYSTPLRFANRYSTDFGEVCLPGQKQDTIWVKNISWLPADAEYSINGSVQDFTVIQPVATKFSINPCDSQRIVVRFRPQSPGTKSLQLKISFSNPSEEITLSYVGHGDKQEAFPQETQLTINPAPAGVVTPVSAIFINPSSATQSRVIAIAGTGSQQIFALDKDEVTIIQSGSPLTFAAQPNDTGWISTQFRVRLRPCDKDTFITVRAYGISPIINGPRERKYSTACAPTMLDTFTIVNSGNDTLEIPLDPSIIENGPSGGKSFSFIGWVTNKNYPRKILPGQSDSVIIRFSSATETEKLAQLLISNNDSTSIRGRKNPFIVTLRGLAERPKVSRSETAELIFPEICAGTVITKKILLQNQGNVFAQVSASNKSPNFSFRLSNNSSGLGAGEKDSAIITFSPKTSGELPDTVLLVINPCTDTIRVPVFGWARSTALTAVPSLLQGAIRTGVSSRRKIVFRSSGTHDAIISAGGFTLTPTRSDWKLLGLPSKDTTLHPGDSIVLEIEFSPAKDTSYKGTLCVSTNLLCPAQACAAIDITSSSNQFALSLSEILFDEMRCDSGEKFSSVYAMNIGNQPVGIKNIFLKIGKEFFISEPAQKNFLLEKDSSRKISVRFTAPGEGGYHDTLIVETDEVPNKIHRIPISASYKTTRSIPDKNFADFGTLEKCDVRQTREIFVKNWGLLDDTLIIEKKLFSGGFAIEPAETLIVRSGTTEKIILSFDPNIASRSDSAESYIFKSIVCDKNFQIDTRAKIITPGVTITPQFIDFGMVAQGSSKDSVITISNTSGFDIDISEVKFDPVLDVFSGQNFSSQTLRNGGEIKIPVKFSALRTGDFTTKILFVTRSRCTDTIPAELRANVPAESYALRLRMDDHEGTAGLPVMVPVVMEETIDRADIRKISLQIEFLSDLIPYVKNIFSADGTKRKIPFAQQKGAVEITLDKAARGRDLDSAGNLFVMEMLTTIWHPSETSLHFADVKIESERTVVAETKDGRIHIEYCPPIWGFRILPEFSSQVYAEQNSPEIQVKISSTGEQNLRVLLTDITGVQRAKENFFVEKGEKILSFNSAQLPSGVYFVMVQNSIGISERHKIVIVR